MTVTHTSNGPRLTNATYYGVTADGAIRVERTVSTWATEDFPRYLHSFRYEVLRNVTYRRLAFYLLGGDWYNFVLNPSLAYGSRKLDRHLVRLCFAAVSISNSGPSEAQHSKAQTGLM